VLCDTDNGTTVAAHLPGAIYGMSTGMGEKTHDWLSAQLCDDCHRRMDNEWRTDARIRMVALCRTLERLFSEGLIEIRDDQRNPPECPRCGIHRWICHICADTKTF
jgi:hypothetical protein